VWNLIDVEVSIVLSAFSATQRTDIRRSIFGNGPFWKQVYVCDRL